MLNRCVAGLTVCVIIIGATAAALAAYSALAMRPAPVPADLAINAFVAERQQANRAAKTDRLASLMPVKLAETDPQAAYALASADPIARERTDAPAAVAAPAMPAAIPNPPETSAAPAAEPKQSAVQPAPAPVPVPHEKPRHLLPPPPPAPPAPAAAAGGVLDENQIAGLKGRLRLTSDQAEYWPAVEAALREVVRTQLRGMHTKIARGGRMTIDVNSPEVQRLIWAAMPLLARLREDQKTEVRKLARVIGLEQVASQI